MYKSKNNEKATIQNYYEASFKKSVIAILKSAVLVIVARSAEKWF